jgi:hypothetical protein
MGFHPIAIRLGQDLPSSYERSLAKNEFICPCFKECSSQESMQRFQFSRSIDTEEATCRPLITNSQCMWLTHYFRALLENVLSLISLLLSYMVGTMLSKLYQIIYTQVIQPSKKTYARANAQRLSRSAAVACFPFSSSLLSLPYLVVMRSQAV